MLLLSAVEVLGTLLAHFFDVVKSLLLTYMINMWSRLLNYAMIDWNMSIGSDRVKARQAVQGLNGL